MIMFLTITYMCLSRHSSSYLRFIFFLEIGHIQHVLRIPIVILLISFCTFVIFKIKVWRLAMYDMLLVYTIYMQ